LPPTPPLAARTRPHRQQSPLPALVGVAPYDDHMAITSANTTPMAGRREIRDLLYTATLLPRPAAIR